MAKGMTGSPVTPIRRTPSAPGNGGDGGDYGERLATIEERVKHLATKEDIQKIKVWCLSGVLGGMALAAGVALAVLRLVQ